MKPKKLLSLLLTIILRIVLCLLILLIAETYFHQFFVVFPAVNILNITIYGALGVPGMIAVYAIVWMGNLE